MKRIKLEVMKTVMGRPFRNVARGSDGNPIVEYRLDEQGNKLMAVPRDEKGNPVAGAQPEPVYQNKTIEMGLESLPELLKTLYLNLEVVDRRPEADDYHMTRLDTQFGTKLFRDIDRILDYKDGRYTVKKGVTHLELAEDVHDKVIEWLKNEKIGLRVFRLNLAIIEEALDNFERLHEKKEKSKEE